MDQAFAAALRQANLKAQHRTFTGDALALSQKVEQLKQLVAQDQAQVDSLTPPPDVHAKPGEQPAADSDELEVAKAQLGLDSDELDDAQDDLDRASGDRPQSDSKRTVRARRVDEEIRQRVAQRRAKWP